MVCYIRQLRFNSLPGAMMAQIRERMGIINKSVETVIIFLNRRVLLKLFCGNDSSDLLAFFFLQNVINLLSILKMTETFTVITDNYFKICHNLKKKS